MRVGGFSPFVLLGVILVCVFGTAAKATVPPDRLVSASGIGPVRLGMTVAQARQALHGFDLSRASDAEGVALIDATQSGRTMLRLFAGEDDADAAIDSTATIISIEAVDPAFRTAAGIGPQSPFSAVEQAYGRLVRIQRSEVEQREYAEFEHQPPGLAFRVAGADGGEAGDYEPGADMTSRARPDARILFVTVTARFP
jgi:hypothetical protein